MQRDSDQISIPKSVTKIQVSIIVKNARKAAQNFTRIFGVGPWVEEIYEGIEAELRGRPTNYKIVAFSADLGPLEIELQEVLEGESLYKEFYEKHGEGVHHIGLYVKNAEKEIEKWQSHGIKVLQKSRLRQPPYPPDGIYAYMDTEPLVGVLLELAYPPPPGLVLGPKEDARR